MSNFDNNRQKKEEAKEREKNRRENIGKYYLDLSKLTFAALVLGSITYTFSNESIDYSLVWIVMAGGLASTVILAKIGNQILK